MSSSVVTDLLGLAGIWRNPVFERFRRSRLRFRKSIFWILLTLIITTFAVSLSYVIGQNVGLTSELAARRIWISLLIIQGLILLIKGTGSVSAGLIQDKIDQTIDYQRLTPLKPIHCIVGYLFGLPVLEYVMFALTLPHLVFVVVVGDIPLTTVLSVYAAFFCCAMLYHTTAIAAGMVMRRWILGYLLSVFLVLVVNVILPTFISQLGLKFVQYLSMWPVISQKVAPLVFSLDGSGISQNIYLSFADAVPFYDWTLSPFAFTLVLQVALIATFGVMALRRWESEAKHSLSKTYALGFLSVFVVVLIGNVWPAITGQYMPFAIFGETNIERLREGIAIAFPLVYCFVLWWLCFALLAIVIPSHHACVRGIRRALKRGRSRALAWDDDATNVPFLMLFPAVAVAGFAVLFAEISSSGFLEFVEPSERGFWRLPVSLGLVVAYSVLLLQVLELKKTVLAILLVWFVPILLAVVFSAASQRFGVVHAVVAGLSPIALVVMSGFVPLVPLAPTTFDYELAAIVPGVYVGLASVIAQMGWLAYRWRQLHRKFMMLCDTFGPGAESEIACVTPAET